MVFSIFCSGSNVQAVGHVLVALCIRCTLCIRHALVTDLCRSEHFVCHLVNQPSHSRTVHIALCRCLQAYLQWLCHLTSHVAVLYSSILFVVYKRNTSTPYIHTCMHIRTYTRAGLASETLPAFTSRFPNDALPSRLSLGTLTPRLGYDALASRLPQSLEGTPARPRKVISLTPRLHLDIPLPRYAVKSRCTCSNLHCLYVYARIHVCGSPPRSTWQVYMQT